MKIVYESDHVSIYIGEENNWQYVDWKGIQNFETVKAGCLEMLRIAKHHSLSKVLNDNRQVTSSWSDAADWGGRIWFPAMAEAGVKYFAWVYSPVVYSQLSTNLFLAYAEKGPEIQTLNNLEEAKKWLSEHN